MGGVKRLLLVALGVLLVTAVYYRFARHDAPKYYLLFFVWIAILAVYVFRYGRRSS